MALDFGYFTLSDNHYENNPRDANQFVADIAAEALYADQLGMHSAWIGEHHFNSLGVLFMRQAFAMMPADLFDAARVEGVREWQIFLRVAMPMAKPTLAALSIILFLHSWNNYIWPLLISSDPRMMTSPVAIGTLIGFNRVSWGGIMTGAVLMTAPMLVVFVFLQRYFMAGIAAGAIK